MHHCAICRVLAKYRSAAAGALISCLSLGRTATPQPPIHLPYLLNLLVQHSEELLLALRGVDAPYGGGGKDRHPVRTFLLRLNLRENRPNGSIAETHRIFPLDPDSLACCPTPSRALFSCGTNHSTHHHYCSPRFPPEHLLSPVAGR